MQLPFFNGLIWGTLIGGAGLVVLSLSHDILNLQGLDPEVTVLPVGQSPDMATASEVTAEVNDASARPNTSSTGSAAPA